MKQLINNNIFKWISLILSILAIVTIVILIVLYVIAINVGYAYTLLIDAGSTSSKLTVFKWRDWPFKTNGYVEQLNEERVSPGISVYSNNPSGAFTALQPHIEKLTMQSVPTDLKKSTRLFLAATAGMRLLTLDNPLKADAIVEDLQLQLPRTNLTMNNPYSDVRIMSGRDEGIYAWITVNYLDGKLGNHEEAPVNEKQTIGALDLGGASAQITFVPESNNPAPFTSIRNLYGQTFTIYSYSYLCYGKSAAQDRIWAEIIGQKTEALIENPCLPAGKIMQVANASTLFEHQCVSSKYAADLVGPALTRPENVSSTITFNGTGNATECRAVVEKMFPPGVCVQKPCMFHGVYRPPLRGEFYAFSGFTYVTNYLNFPSPGLKPQKDEFRRKVEDFCTKPWNDSLNLSDTVALYCFDGIYIEALLSHFGFSSSDSWQSIAFTKSINDVTVSWAPGYAIDATGMSESTSPKINLGTVPFIVSVVVLCMIFILLLVINIIALFLNHKQKSAIDKLSKDITSDLSSD